MAWEIGFLISLGFAGATAWVFVLSLMAQLVRPGISWRLPCAAAALLGNQLGTWLVQQFLHMNPAAMGVVDAILVGCAIVIARRYPLRWAAGFAFLAGLQFLLTVAYCVAGDGAYVAYVCATDATFAALLLWVGTVAGHIAFARRRAVQIGRA